MNTVREYVVRKIRALEWMLISYLVVGFLLACVCLTIDGEARFGAFSLLGLYASPAFFVISIFGLGEGLFAEWPTAIFWMVSLIFVNGLSIYALAKLATIGWHRRRKVLP